MTVRQLLASIDSVELTEWMAFERLEGFGSLVDDLRIGQVAATVANVNRDSKARPQPFRPSDFMPQLGAELDRHQAGMAPPVASADPKARSAMLAAMLFGRIRE